MGEPDSTPGVMTWEELLEHMDNLVAWGQDAQGLEEDGLGHPDCHAECGRPEGAGMCGTGLDASHAGAEQACERLRGHVQGGGRLPEVHAVSEVRGARQHAWRD